MNRPAALAVPGLSAKARAARDRWFNMMDRGHRKEPTTPSTSKPERPSVFSGLIRPALQGLACQYDTVFADNEGRLLVLQSGSLTKSLHDGRPKRLLVDHDDTLEVGSSNAGLEFDNNGAFGLSMRFPLSNSAVHTRLAEFVRDGKRACLSIGGAITKAQTKTIAGHQVEFVEEFRLDEVSVCFQGANTPAFVELIDLDNEQASLAAAAREPGFRTKVAVNKAVATTRRIDQRLAEAKPGALDGKASGKRARKSRSYTVDQSNRWQTERTEALQKGSRTTVV